MFFKRKPHIDNIDVKFWEVNGKVGITLKDGMSVRTHWSKYKIAKIK